MARLRNALSAIFRSAASPAAKRKGCPLLEILPWLTLALSLALTQQMWLHARRDAESALQLDFDYRARKVVDDIGTRMKAYEQVMRGVDSLFAQPAYVNRTRFHDYIRQLQLERTYPGIRGIRFVPLVQHEAKERHIAAIRREGMPSYSIWPGGRRDAYAPVAYSEPLDPRDAQAVGYDMLSDYDLPLPGDAGRGLRRAAMEQARDSGEAVASGRLGLLYKGGQEKLNDFAMFLPVYKYGTPHKTVAERRANIVGWVCSVFNADELMGDMLDERHDKIGVEIYDGEKVSGSTMLYHSEPEEPGRNYRFMAVRQIRVADHSWTVLVRSLPNFDRLLDVERPRIIAATGVAASVLLAAFLWMLNLGRKRAVEASARLRLESRKHEMLLRTASDGIHICDLDGNLVEANDAFFRMLGYAPEEMSGAMTGEMPGMNMRQWDAQLPAAGLGERSDRLRCGGLTYETRYRCRDGKLIDVEISSSLVEITGRQLIYNSARDITQRKAADQQLHDLTVYLQSVREEEKISLAREIHDDLGGMLTAMKIESYWARAELTANNLEGTALSEHVREISRLIDSASAVMRDVVTGLRPTILDDLGLLAALEWQAVRFQKLTGIRSRVNCIGDKGGLDRGRSIELFRILQEALSNVARHSGATCVEIEFHHTDEEVVLSVIDNGRGMTAEQTGATRHFGLLGMRERADQLGGALSIDTPPGGGFSLTVTLPLPAGKEEKT